MSHYNYMKCIATGNTWNVTGHKKQLVLLLGYSCIRACIRNSSFTYLFRTVLWMFPLVFWEILAKNFNRV